MRSSRKSDPKGRADTKNSAPSSKGKGGDQASQKLGSLSRLLGNQSLDSRIQEANVQQKALMDFILSRLQNIEQVQQIELQEMRDSRDWYKEAAKGRDGYGLPDATRWHESAHLYQRAGQALCRGDLGRGADLLERATAEERRAQDSTPRQVAEHLNDASRAHAQSPMGAEELSTAAVCSAIIEPQELKVADRIRNIQDVMETSPPLPIRSTKHWWEEEEEEEEEGESGDS